MNTPFIKTYLLVYVRTVFKNIRKDCYTKEKDKVSTLSCEAAFQYLLPIQQILHHENACLNPYVM